MALVRRFGKLDLKPKSNERVVAGNDVDLTVASLLPPIVPPSGTFSQRSYDYMCVRNCLSFPLFFHDSFVSLFWSASNSSRYYCHQYFYIQCIAHIHRLLLSLRMGKVQKKGMDQPIKQALVEVVCFTCMRPYTRRSVLKHRLERAAGRNDARSNNRSR